MMTIVIKDIFLKLMLNTLKDFHNLHCNSPFLPERMKINKFNKLICNLYDKNNYVVHIISLKQALDHGIILKQVHKVIQFNQEV